MCSCDPVLKQYQAAPSQRRVVQALSELLSLQHVVLRQAANLSGRSSTCLMVSCLKCCAC